MKSCHGVDAFKGAAAGTPAMDVLVSLAGSAPARSPQPASSAQSLQPRGALPLCSQQQQPLLC